MSVSVNTERKLVEVRWDPQDYEGQVTVFAFGQADDPHNTAPGPNDGLRALSYPAGFQGSSDIEIRTEDGTVLDSGPITVG